jgi:hypothetical protein
MNRLPGTDHVYSSAEASLFNSGHAPWMLPQPGAGGVDLTQCEYDVPNTNLTFSMCGNCPVKNAPSWWPTAAKPPHGEDPGYWPPGYHLERCASCAGNAECKLGCMFNFRPSLVPEPPAPPSPPAPRPPQPACGPMPSTQGGSQCQLGKSLNFSNVFSDHAVLQMAPAKSAVYGYVGTGASGSSKVTVTVADAADASATYTVEATVDEAKGTWKAFLKPAKSGGSYGITAACTSGCTGSAALGDVTFGNVWYCAGQSNSKCPLAISPPRSAIHHQP